MNNGKLIIIVKTKKAIKAGEQLLYDYEGDFK